MHIMDVYGQNYDLLVDGTWVVNGAYTIEIDADLSYATLEGVYSHPYMGSIGYDGDYNSTLERFSKGERAL